MRDKYFSVIFGHNFSHKCRIKYVCNFSVVCVNTFAVHSVLCTAETEINKIRPCLSRTRNWAIMYATRTVVNYGGKCAPLRIPPVNGEPASFLWTVTIFRSFFTTVQDWHSSSLETAKHLGPFLQDLHVMVFFMCDAIFHMWWYFSCVMVFFMCDAIFHVWWYFSCVMLFFMCDLSSRGGDGILCTATKMAAWLVIPGEPRWLSQRK
jgi:hypothetical protein